MLTLNRQSVVLRTNRLVELYQHLMSYFTGRRNAAGEFDIATSDYINTRRESRNNIFELDDGDDIYTTCEDPYGYVSHSPSPRHTPNTSPSSSRRSQTPDRKLLPKPLRPPPSLPSPDLVRPSATKLPKLAPHHLAKKTSPVSKPEPPPKPKNAREIMSEFENGNTNSSRNFDEPIYKSIRKPKSSISASSIGIRGLSDSSFDYQQAPPLPATPPEYSSFNLFDRQLGSPHNAGSSPEADYMNVMPRRSSEIARLAYRPDVIPRRISEDSILVDKSTNRLPNRQNAMRTPPRPTLEEEEESDLYDSIYAMGIYSDPLDQANLPPPRDSWLKDPLEPSEQEFEEFPQFDEESRPSLPQKVLISKIQRFDKKILRKVN